MFRNSNSLGRFREVSLEQAGLTVSAALDRAEALTPEQGVRIAMEHAEIFSNVTMSLEAMSLELESFDREASTLSLDMQAFYGAWDAISRASIPDKSQVAQMVGKGMPRFRKKYRLSFEADYSEINKVLASRKRHVETSLPSAGTTPPPSKPASSDVEDDPFDINKILDDKGAPYAATLDDAPVATGDVDHKEDSALVKEARAKAEAEKGFFRTLWDKFVAMLKSIWEAIKKFFNSDDSEKRLEKTKVKIIKVQELHEKIQETVPLQVLRNNDVEIIDFKLNMNDSSHGSVVASAKKAEKTFSSTVDSLLRVPDVMGEHFEHVRRVVQFYDEEQDHLLASLLTKANKELVEKVGKDFTGSGLDMQTKTSIYRTMHLQDAGGMGDSISYECFDMVLGGKYIVLMLEEGTELGAFMCRVRVATFVRDVGKETSIKFSEILPVIDSLKAIAEKCEKITPDLEKKAKELKVIQDKLIADLHRFNDKYPNLSHPSRLALGQETKGIGEITGSMARLAMSIRTSGEYVTATVNQLKNALEAYQLQNTPK